MMGDSLHFFLCDFRCTNVHMPIDLHGISRNDFTSHRFGQRNGELCFAHCCRTRKYNQETFPFAVFFFFSFFFASFHYVTCSFPLRLLPGTICQVPRPAANLTGAQYLLANAAMADSPET